MPRVPPKKKDKKRFFRSHIIYQRSTPKGPPEMGPEEEVEPILQLSQGLAAPPTPAVARTIPNTEALSSARRPGKPGQPPKTWFTSPAASHRPPGLPRSTHPTRKAPKEGSSSWPRFLLDWRGLGGREVAEGVAPTGEQHCPRPGPTSCSGYATGSQTQLSPASKGASI